MYPLSVYTINDQTKEEEKYMALDLSDLIKTIQKITSLLTRIKKVLNFKQEEINPSKCGYTDSSSCSSVRSTELFCVHDSSYMIKNVKELKQALEDVEDHWKFKTPFCIRICGDTLKIECL